MRRPVAICALGTAAAVIGLTGCGSGTDTSTPSSVVTSSSEVTSTSAQPSTGLPTPAAPAQNQTIDEYLREQGVGQTAVKRGDPGAPQLNLPMPPGWEDIGADIPADAYGAIVLTSAAQTPNPPAIVARMARLDGEVDTDKLLEYAPNAVTRAPGWDGPVTGQPSQLGGFDAVQIAGTAVIDGEQMFIARKTVVIPGPDNVFLLALDAQGPVDQEPELIDAMAVIDDQTSIGF
ncbi:LpqN/LpqT family lipoprotein [Mycobacterium sp. Y57]|uniref:LpqN/LpqT family lipoprotein n=1 Tax=Mycolicibacterium xanthum TaxID=2796469 RepID=UPI001C85EB4C|nr:LpqN/LpqT family lipoprotein [Mycolicibacterium xanthum]MBX7432137.1 LpqN/LpqT family lipoprotein [Mycolicibacterium xanthum]